jgi:hypothetical protein
VNPPVAAPSRAPAVEHVAGFLAPPVPQTLAATGLSSEALSDMILKTIYAQGSRSGMELHEVIRLPFPLLDDRLLDLQQRLFVEVRAAHGTGRGGYVYELSNKGRERAREAMETNQYVGPAPVPLEHYRAWVEAQSIRRVTVTRDRIRSGFSHLVLDPRFLEQLGPAINSAKSMFLYGDAGNGKTNLAESIARLLGGDIFVPHAVLVDGQIMVIHDPVYHRARPEPGAEPPGEGPTWLRAAPAYDRRFAHVSRPVVFTGGELTLDQLDLEYDPHTRISQAPFQVKANGGVLIIDDFGRQRVEPRDLLNRWIVPLEKRVDFLTLHTGHKFPVPFDCLLIFATNLDPLDLVDEAFLRRIHYKIHVPSPTYLEYEQIFRRCCVARQLPFRSDRVRYVHERYYQRLGLEPRGCHPRDILDHLGDSARYLENEPELTEELLDRACASYFLDMPDTPAENPSSAEVSGEADGRHEASATESPALAEEPATAADGE